MAIDQSGILSVGGGGNMPGRSGGGGSVKLANRRGMAPGEQKWLVMVPFGLAANSRGESGSNASAVGGVGKTSVRPIKASEVAIPATEGIGAP
jgi:hypothetical protein